MDAKLDWEKRRGVFMHCGDLHSSRPLINKVGFYVRLSWDSSYVSDYNSEMNRLVSENGVPDWTPGKRIPSRAVVRELLLNGSPYEKFKPSNKKEESLIKSVEYNWLSEHQCLPKLVAIDSNRQILVLGGLTAKGYRVDLIDLEFKSWMYVYEPGQISEL
jgi:hypothetical protein